MGSKLVEVGAPGLLDIRTWQGATFDLTVTVGTTDRTGLNCRFAATYRYDQSVVVDVNQAGDLDTVGRAWGLAAGAVRVVVPRPKTVLWPAGVFDFMWEADDDPLVQGLLIVKPSAVIVADDTEDVAAMWAGLAGMTMSQGQ